MEDSTSLNNYTVSGTTKFTWIGQLSDL
jgi:hypothetical protein